MNKIIKFILVTALSVTSFGYLSAENGASRGNYRNSSEKGI